MKVSATVFTAFLAFAVGTSTASARQTDQSPTREQQTLQAFPVSPDAPDERPVNTEVSGTVPAVAAGAATAHDVSFFGDDKKREISAAKAAKFIQKLKAIKIDTVLKFVDVAVAVDYGKKNFRYYKKRSPDGDHAKDRYYLVLERNPYQSGLTNRAADIVDFVRDETIRLEDNRPIKDPGRLFAFTCFLTDPQKSKNTQTFAYDNTNQKYPNYELMACKDSEGQSYAQVYMSSADTKRIADKITSYNALRHNKSKWDMARFLYEDTILGGGSRLGVFILGKYEPVTLAQTAKANVPIFTELTFRAQFVEFTDQAISVNTVAKVNAAKTGEVVCAAFIAATTAGVTVQPETAPVVAAISDATEVCY